MNPVTVFDLEFTAWEHSMAERWMDPGEFREVVQIGAVKIDAQTFAPLGELNLLVKPRINPVLSDYLVRLTGVTNEAIGERGVDFADAYGWFVAFCGGGTICSFGRDDHVLEENLRLYAIRDAPPLPRHVNAAPWLRENGIQTKGAHACDVARLCGAQFFGREHDALEDARSVALGIQTLVVRGVANPLA
jgi:inhibitor of KinA sporulation pathway (predicted exonuclease)